jgi:DNA-binding transcriptional MerR regulator
MHKLHNENEAAELLGCTVSALRKWRTLGKGPAFCRVGGLVRYSELDLSAFLDANRVQPVGGGR